MPTFLKQSKYEVKLEFPEGWGFKPENLLLQGPLPQSHIDLWFAPITMSTNSLYKELVVILTLTAFCMSSRSIC